jgi:uncharacterized protein (UPF0335 family)
MNTTSRKAKQGGDFDPMGLAEGENPPTSDGQPRPANDTGRELTAFVERIERLEDEKAVIGEDIKSVKAECKAKGYDMKVVAEMLKLRKMDATEREEWENLRDTYGHALGIFG